MAPALIATLPVEVHELLALEEGGLALAADELALLAVQLLPQLCLLLPHFHALLLLFLLQRHAPLDLSFYCLSVVDFLLVGLLLLAHVLPLLDLCQGMPFVSESVAERADSLRLL